MSKYIDREERRERLGRFLKNTRAIVATLSGPTLQLEEYMDDLNWLDDWSVELEREPNILERANEITDAGGARREAYQHPSVDFRCTAALWTAVLQRQAARGEFSFSGSLPTELVPLLMICVKLSRLAGQLDHEDSALDIAGYARCLEMLWEDAL